MTRSAISAAMCAFSRGVGEPRVVGRQRNVAVIVVDGGHARLVTVPIDGGPEHVITTSPGPRSARTLGGGVHDVSADGDTTVFVSSSGGLWQAPMGGGPPALIEGTDDARQIASPVVSPDGGRVAYVLDEHRVEVADVDVGPGVGQSDEHPRGERRGRVLVSARADFALDPAWSADGRHLYWHEWDVPAMPWDASSIVRCDMETGEISHVAGGTHAVSQPRVSPDGQHLAFLSDATGWLTLWMSRLDGTGARQVLDDRHEHGGPTWGPGQRSFAWSPSSAQIALTRNEDGFGALVIADVATSAAVTVSRGTHGGLEWVDEQTIVAVRTGARTPTHLVALDLAESSAVTTGNVLDRTVIDPPVVKAPRRTLLSTTVAGFDDHLCEPELVSWAAPDGMDIPARLFRCGDGPQPLIVWIHGGPTDQWQVTFRPRFPFFMSRGWSILVPDHRGSTGHGRDFAQALNGRWGDADVSDVVAGIEHGASAGWADPDRIVVMGSSSGGATVLNILGRHPGLCAAGISLFGVADFGATAAATHRFEAHYFDTIVGPPGDVALWRDRSPLATVDQIADPLLLLHGSDDDVVPVEQSRSIHRMLSDADRQVDLHVYRGEGHGWGRPEVVIDELERIEGFLAEHVAASPPNE